MLARYFLSAEELSLTDEEYDALTQVLGALERGEMRLLPPVERPLDCGPASVGRAPDYFCMAMVNRGVYLASGECGTAACMLGWARHFSGNPHLFELDNPARLYSPNGLNALALLFYQRVSPDITPARAAQALRGYLTTGAPDWTSVT